MALSRASWVIRVSSRNQRRTRIPGGFQGQVSVTAGSTAITRWTVTWTLASGQAITQLWNGALSTSGTSVTVKNLSYNGSLAAGASTTFGFNGTGAATVPTVACSTA